MAAHDPHGGLVGRSEGKGMTETLTCFPKRASVLGNRTGGWRGTDLMGEEAGSAPVRPARAAPYLARSPLLRPHSSHCPEVDLLGVPEDVCLSAPPTAFFTSRNRCPPAPDPLSPWISLFPPRLFSAVSLPDRTEDHCLNKKLYTSLKALLVLL